MRARPTRAVDARARSAGTPAAGPRIATDPGFALRFWDACNRLASVRALKPLMLDLMDLHRGQRVLEVGCGTGDDVRTIARRVGAQGLVVGIDSSPLVIEEARRRTDPRASIEFRVGDVLGLELPDEAFDRCRVERLLMHVPGEPANAMAELVRVLRPGGRLVVFEIDWDAFVVECPDHALTRRILRSYADGVPNGWVGRALRRLLLDAGLADVRTTPYAVELPFDFFTWVLSGHLDAALSAGQFRPEELIAWWDQIDAIHERGRFYSAMLGVIATGVKPG